MTMTASCWMIYGANGYTGELVAREAKKQGLNPILAGRNTAKVRALANELGFESRIFDLGQGLPTGLTGIDIVLHCAGPFSDTSPPMIEACISAGIHYLDITGEIAVFEYAFSQHSRALKAGTVICPGVGFDVIPTDCIAAHLAEALPDATRLSLGFDTHSGMSAGTAKTSIEGLAGGGKVRRNGDIVTVPLAFGVRRIDFGNGEKLAMTLPWGDVSTAWYTTGICDIAVYVPASPKLIKRLKRMNRIRPLLALSPVQTLLKAWIERRVKGPDEASRDRMPSYVWGEAIDHEGNIHVARVKTANGYTVTMYGSIEIVKYMLENSVEGGTYTPSRLAGKDLVERLPGSGKVVVGQA